LYLEACLRPCYLGARSKSESLNSWICLYRIMNHEIQLQIMKFSSKSWIVMISTWKLKISWNSTFWRESHRKALQIKGKLSKMVKFVKSKKSQEIVKFMNFGRFVMRCIGTYESWWFFQFRRWNGTYCKLSKSAES
jgi:hypothetical protein